MGRVTPSINTPFSFGVSGLTLPMGQFTNGGYESFSLCANKEGMTDESRLEFTQAVNMETILNAAQSDAQNLMPAPQLPVSCIQTADTATRTVELSEVLRAVTIALHSVNTTVLRDVFARMVPAKAATLPINLGL